MILLEKLKIGIGLFILYQEVIKYLLTRWESINFNMVGQNKVQFIKENLKIHDFDYLGNSKKDLPIWEYTKKIIFTNASPELKSIIKQKKFAKLEILSDFD